MRMNVFAVNSSEDVDEFSGREPGGNRALRLVDAEDELVRMLDEEKMSPEKLLATRFLSFLGDNELNMEKLKLLSVEEQNQLRKQFLEL